MATSSNGAVFFLGSRAHYEVLEQPNNYDAENGNTSTETIYQNQSVEELWPNNKRRDLDANYNPEAINWNYCDNTGIRAVENTKPVNCVKRRIKRHSSETLLYGEKPTILINVEQEEQSKSKSSCRVSLFNFLTSLARRKRNLESDQVHYLQNFESVLTNCTYRESCRCLDCQSRYFECDEESDEYSSDNDYCVFSQQDVNQTDDELDDDVFINTPPDNDNTSTDLLLDDQQEEEPTQEIVEDDDTDKQLQMEVAASTSAMFNILLYHPFSCAIQ